MAGPTNLKLLTDFFNKIGQQRTSPRLEMADHDIVHSLSIAGVGALLLPNDA